MRTISMYGEKKTIYNHYQHISYTKDFDDIKTIISLFSMMDDVLFVKLQFILISYKTKC